MLLFICSLFFFDSCTKSVDIDTVQVTQLAVWNKAPHNAFTDLIKFNNAYYCVFREGKNHLSYDGKLRIVRSMDGKKWDSFTLLALPAEDLRDPHFFIDNNNQLSVSSNARIQGKDDEAVCFKLKNNGFVQTDKVNVDNDYWLWGFTKRRDKLYTIGYNTKQICYSRVNSAKPKLMMFENTDTACINYGRIQPEQWLSKDFKCPSEASLVFTTDSTLIVIVRDENTQGKSHLGISKYPFTTWDWKLFPYHLRGPKLALLPDGKIFLCAASMVAFNTTYYAILNPDDFSIEKIKAFPSGGDTGYPGVIIEGSSALVSYYSSHEGNARVYIQRINY